MKLYAPEYYREFACIADKCKHSCCVGWEIDIDGDTLTKYDSLPTGYGDKIKESIARDSDGAAHFMLGGDGTLGAERCPHLDECGLCRIISELGEGYLCDICREHPRFYNYTAKGREVGLGMACEEACRLILTSDGYGRMVEVADARDEETLADSSENDAFDALPYREDIYSLLSDRYAEYEQRLESLEKRYDVSPKILSDGEWREILASLEYLDEGHRELFSGYSSDVATPKALEKMLERALAYFIFRHCTEACSEEDLRASLGFCMFMERLIASVADKSDVADKDLSGMVEIARAVSEEIEYSEENTDALRAVFIY